MKDNTVARSQHSAAEMIENVRATFAMEGITLDDVSMDNITRIATGAASGAASGEEVVAEILKKYKNR